MISANHVDDTGLTDIEVQVTHGSIRIDTTEIERLARSVIESEGVAVKYLGIILCGRNEHVDLHRRYARDPSPTDVLAFDLEPESEALDAEIYVDLDTARERHSEFGATFHEEVFRYVVHGLLHLLGYGDKNESDATRMTERQEFLLKSFQERQKESK